MIKMTRVHLDVFLYLSILTSCCGQRLLFHCDFDLGLNDACRFANSPGAPAFDAPIGVTSSVRPTQPLSDVKSITSLTTPNNEPCQLPYTYAPDTWPTYFCRSASASNYTCQTASGLGNCVLGRYGLIKTTQAGISDHTYTASNAVTNALNTSQCLDFYYYLTDTSFYARIEVEWSAGLAPSAIVAVQAQSENKWQRSRTTYETRSEPNYTLWLRILRESGPAGFFFALDEIKVFDGPCESPITVGPQVTDSSQMTTRGTIASTANTNKITTEGSTLGTIVDQTAQSNPTDDALLTKTSSSTTTTTSAPAGVVTTTPIPTSSVTTTTTTNTNPISDQETKLNLTLIFGLVFGLGLPVVLFSILGLAYYCQVVKAIRKVTVHTSNDTELLEVPVKSSTRRMKPVESTMY